MLTRTYWMMTIVKEMYTARGISLNSQKDDNDCMTCILIQTTWQNKTKQKLNIPIVNLNQYLQFQCT